MAPIVPEDRDYDNWDLERRVADRRSREPSLFSLYTDDDGGLVMTWVKAIAIVGTPSAIALYLVYRLTVGLPILIDKQAALETLATTAAQEQTRQTEKLNALHRLLTRICINTARTDDERAKCFD